VLDLYTVNKEIETKVNNKIISKKVVLNPFVGVCDKFEIVDAEKFTEMEQVDFNDDYDDDDDLNAEDSNVANNNKIHAKEEDFSSLFFRNEIDVEKIKKIVNEKRRKKKRERVERNKWKVFKDVDSFKAEDRIDEEYDEFFSEYEDSDNDTEEFKGISNYQPAKINYFKNHTKSPDNKGKSFNNMFTDENYDDNNDEEDENYVSEDDNGDDLNDGVKRTYGYTSFNNNDCSENDDFHTNHPDDLFGNSKITSKSNDRLIGSPLKKWDNNLQDSDNVYSHSNIESPQNTKSNFFMPQPSSSTSLNISSPFLNPFRDNFDDKRQTPSNYPTFGYLIFHTHSFSTLSTVVYRGASPSILFLIRGIII
jgi:hypothetical protein